MGIALTLILAACLLVAAVLEWLAHRKVKAIKAHEVTPEAVRYVSQRSKGGQ